MIEIYPDTIVYILCPAQIHSGGPELLHQLASHLLCRGVDVRMYYVPVDLPDPVDSYYKKYDIPFTKNIEDKSSNVLIFPETGSGFLYNVQ